MTWKTPPPTHLLHFSGGMDSTYVLYKHLLTRPFDRILVHHIQLRHTAEDRLQQEQRAVDHILHYFRTHGLTNFETHTSAFDYGTLPRISIKDIQIVSLFTGIILRTPRYSNIHTLHLSWHQGEVDNDEIKRGFRVRAMLTALDTGHDLRFNFPIADMSRADMAADMPPELLAMVHSCRKPTNGNHCRRCKTCLELKQAGILDVVGQNKTTS